MGIDITKRLTNSNFENLNNLIENIYRDSLIDKFSLINYKNYYSIKEGIFLERTYIQILNIEKFEFEYNFNNEYKIYGNGILIGFVYIEENLDIKESFLFIENYIKSYQEDYFYNNNIYPDLEQTTLIREIIKEQTLNDFKIKEIKSEKPFFREMEFKHRKKEKFRC